MDDVVAPFPTIATDLGVFRGRAAFLFLRRTVEAASIVRMRLAMDIKT